MAVTADKFSRLAALKPMRPIPARPAAIRTPDEADALGRLLGAGVARNHFGEQPVLVTFNGKSFDWPLLENRFTMTRSIAVPKLAAHLDLLHPARVLWKLRLGSVRLVELERHVIDAPRLGWHRENDVASALIPQRSEEHTSELQSQSNLVCRLLLEKKKKQKKSINYLSIHITYLANRRTHAHPPAPFHPLS